LKWGLVVSHYECSGGPNLSPVEGREFIGCLMAIGFLGGILLNGVG